MKIELTKTEYRELLDVLFIAEWVLHAFDAGNRSRMKHCDRIIQNIFSHAGSQGMEHLIARDAETGELFPSREFDNSTPVWELIDWFADETFWDELIHRLSERDAARRAGGYEHLDVLGPAEFMTLENPIRKRYEAEFGGHGLERLEIVESFASDPLFPHATHD